MFIQLQPRPSLLRTGIFALALALALVSCSAPPSKSVIDAALRGDVEGAARSAIEEELQRQGVPTDAAGVQEVLDAFVRLVSEVWGEREPEVASKRRYVKYSGEYQARVIVDFEAGYLQVETVATEDPVDALRQAVIGALLTDRDLTVEDIFSSSEPSTGGEPFLFRQVLDADGQPIRWEWRANRFADYLIANVLNTRREHGRVIRSVRTDLVSNHLKLRELEYSDSVLKAARRYAVSPSLIYAVIEVESAFNPYAVSPANAYGLMQVVPATAGRDVFEKVKGIGGEPTRQQLFGADFNIDIGSAYLHLLDDTYLSRIGDAQSRRYAVIASYNGGAGSTLKTFDTDRSSALSRINRLSPPEVYAQLVRNHPFSETRQYLQKVHNAEGRYR